MQGQGQVVVSGAMSCIGVNSNMALRIFALESVFQRHTCTYHLRLDANDLAGAGTFGRGAAKSPQHSSGLNSLREILSRRERAAKRLWISCSL